MTTIANIQYSYNSDGTIATMTVTYKSGVQQIKTYVYSSGVLTAEIISYTNGSYTKTINYPGDIVISKTTTT